MTIERSASSPKRPLFKNERFGQEFGYERDLQVQLEIVVQVLELSEAHLARGCEDFSPGSLNLVGLDSRGHHAEFRFRSDDETASAAAAPVFRPIGRHVHEIVRNRSDAVTRLFVDSGVPTDLTGIVVGDPPLYD